MYWLSQFFASPKQNISLLWKLILRPDSCSKAQRIVLMLWACSRLWSIKRIVSSAYCSIDSPSSTKWGTTPLSKPSAFALLMKSVSMSATKLKRMGESGSPCLSLFFVWKYRPTSSLTFIATLPPEMKDLIQSIHLFEKPFSRSVKTQRFWCETRCRAETQRGYIFLPTCQVINFPI